MVCGFGGRPYSLTNRDHARRAAFNEAPTKRMRSQSTLSNLGSLRGVEAPTMCFCHSVSCDIITALHIESKFVGGKRQWGGNEAFRICVYLAWIWRLAKEMEHIFSLE